MRINFANNLSIQKKYQKQTSFKAVSIDPNILKNKPNSVILREGEEKINELQNNGVTEEIQQLDESIDNLTAEMKIRRKIAKEKPWWYRTQAALRQITKTEAEQKNIKLPQKSDAVYRYNQRVQQIKEITEEIAKHISENKVDKSTSRLRESRAFNDYKGTVSNKNGFQKIAGYEQEKAILNKYFISEILKEQNGEESNVPNSVLFFGPTGNGKTTFARAFAIETGCKFVPVIINATTKTDDAKSIFYDKLINTAKKAEENYQKTGIRSIIFIDEITKVADRNSNILDELTDFMQNCSKKYHCTIFCASNHPLNIALPMKGKDAVFPYIVSMDPPDLNNKVDIMKFYLDDIAKDINYPKLAGYMEENEYEKEGIYNIAQIKDEICLTASDQKITEEELRKNIRETNPSISKKDLEKYSKEMDVLINNEVNS